MWDVPLIWFTELYWKVCHIHTITRDGLAYYFHWIQLRFAQNTISAFAFFVSRLPVLMLYLRIFGSNKKFRYAVYFGILAVFAVYLAYVPLLAYFCTPAIGKPWSSLEVFSKCRRLEPFAIVSGSCNIFLDIYILLLPMPMIWRLQMPLQKKIGILAVFTTGAL